MSANYDYLQLSESRIPDEWSIKLTFSLIVSFDLTKPQVELKNLHHSSYAIALSKGTIFCYTNADISKIKEFLELKGIFSETTYVCVRTCQFSSF